MTSLRDFGQAGAGVKAHRNFFGNLARFAGLPAFCQLRGEFTEFLRRHGFGHELDFQLYGLGGQTKGVPVRGAFSV